MHVLEQPDPDYLGNAARVVSVALILLQGVWRVSMQRTGKPVLASPSNSHCDNGPASRLDTDTRFFDRDIKAGLVLHGCASSF